MDTNEASETLHRAADLSGRSRQSTRWFANYLLIFAAGSFAMALAFGLIGPRWGSTIVIPLWMVFVITISVYASRQKTKMLGLMRINTVMMIVWALAWLGTLLGSFALDQPLWWWILGGVAMALAPLVARHIVRRRIAVL